MPSKDMASASSLPEEIWEKIFGYLDSDSLWRVINACESFLQIVKHSPKLLHSLHLCLTSDFFDAQDISRLPRIPVRRISLSNVCLTSGADFCAHYLPPASSDVPIYLPLVLKVLKNYRNSVEKFTVANVHMPLVENLCEMLANFTNLRHFEALDLDFLACHSPCAVHLPSLQSIALTRSSRRGHNTTDLLRLFRHHTTVERVALNVHPFAPHAFDHDSFEKSLRTLPNVRHLSMDGPGTVTYFEEADFPCRLLSLECPLLGFEWTGRVPSTRFLATQAESLRELRLQRLPCDLHGDEVLRFVLEKMRLREFFCGAMAVIAGGERQRIEELSVSEMNVSSLLEMMRQFPTITRLELTISQTEIVTAHVRELLAQPTTLFTKVRQLTVTDSSDFRRSFPHFVDLVRKCRNLRKLSVDSKEVTLAEMMLKFLPFLTLLEEFELICDDFLLFERLSIVRRCCASLKTLRVGRRHVWDAKCVFAGSEVQIEGINV